MYSGKSYIVKSNGHAFELHVDPPTNPGTFTGFARDSFSSPILGSYTITTPIEGGFWMPDEGHTAFIIDWSKSQDDGAIFYPHPKRTRFNGFDSMVGTEPHTPTGSMWSGVMVDLNNLSHQTTWMAHGPIQE
ncbi:hypothetical protein ACFV5J_10570 [Streptomyces zaomyceticus]|uniref:hypothetical protein n=1 Tax=Streptomyces zaomyceticus TaxID=68286 RepID=UPI00365939C2